MAKWVITSFVLLSVALSLVASFEVGARREECPPGDPLCNIWKPCDYNDTVVVSCRDCNTRIICTHLGGWIYPCWVWGHKNCIDGNCVTNPSEECARETNGKA